MTVEGHVVGCMVNIKSLFACAAVTGNGRCGCIELPWTGSKPTGSVPT